jgi:predicted small metal-binding protein
MRELRCGELMPGCKAVIQGKDDNEVIAKATEHAKTVHNVQQMTPDLQNKVQQAIRTT